MKNKTFFIMAIAIFLCFMIPAKSLKASATIVNPAKVYTYKQMAVDIQKLKKQYPNLVQVKTIGKSEYGRDLYAIGLGKGDATVFINGSHHGREWLTTTLNMYMIEQYALAYQSNGKVSGYRARTLLNSTTIWFVPMVNPDGVTLQQLGLAAFPKNTHAALIKMNEGSKNFRRWKANGKGIDLNRQYNAGWRAIKSPTTPKYQNYKGSAPATAKETKAILAFVSQINPEMSVAYHSSGKILFWNFKQNASNYKRDHIYAKYIGKLTGYRLIYPGKNPSGGGFTDWFIESRKKPAFTIEIARSAGQTNPPVSEFAASWQQNKGVGLYVAQESIKLFDTRMTSTTASLQKQLTAINNKAKTLEGYYYTAIKTTDDLKINPQFLTLYNQINKDYKKVSSQVNILPIKYKQKVSSSQKQIEAYSLFAATYIDAIKKGNNLLAVKTTLLQNFETGTINAKTIQTYNTLANQLEQVKTLTPKLYSVRVQNLIKQAFSQPAVIAIENNQYEVLRSSLLDEMEQQLADNQIDLVEANLLKLEQYELNSIVTKQAGNELYPGLYPTYPELEKKLAERKQTILDKLAN